MKKTDEQERNIASRLYNLDKKVYETTGSTLGRVFPSSPSFALEKIIDSLKINREYFLKNEMTLIANMIGTIKDEEKSAPLKQEYDELEKDILAYNPAIILPHSIDNNDAVASRRFSSDNNLIICISRQFGTGGHTIGFELAQRLGIAYYDKEIIHLAFLCGHFADKITLGEKEHIRLYGEELFRSFSKITQYSAAAMWNAIRWQCLMPISRRIPLHCLSSRRHWIRRCQNTLQHITSM